jgi:hypothetical protein
MAKNRACLKNLERLSFELILRENFAGGAQEEVGG